MKAIRVHEPGGPEVLKLEDVADPKPGAGEVLVRIRAAGVNPVETYIRTGTIYKPAQGYPYTPGSDGAGEIVAIGSGVEAGQEHIAPGQRVYLAGAVTGTYAEMAVCRASQVYALPDRVSFAQGAAVHVPYATAYRALMQRARAEAGDWVLVHGATGGVGVAAVQIARAAGMFVIGTGGTEKGREMASAQGAHHALDHHAGDYLEKAKALTPGGRGFDVILEMAAHINLGKDLPLLARGGRVVVIGSRGPVEVNARDIMMSDGAILGMVLGLAAEAAAVRAHAAIGVGLANGSLNPVVGREFPLAEAARAHEAVMEPGALGKIVLVPQQ